MAALTTSIAALSKSGLGTALFAGGTALSAVSQVQAGNAQQAAAEFQARQLEQQATAERAAASVEAGERRQETMLLMSRARAVGAASGGGIDFFGLGDLAEEGARRERMAVWQGEERAKGRSAQAAASRFEGQQMARAGRIGAFSTALSGGASFLEKYGGSEREARRKPFLFPS